MRSTISLSLILLLAFLLSTARSKSDAGNPTSQGIPASGSGDPMEIYTRHCTPCHGERGRGDGPAARFLDPPPRDFDRGAFRLVSTTNGTGIASNANR